MLCGLVLLESAHAPTSVFHSPPPHSLSPTLPLSHTLCSSGISSRGGSFRVTVLHLLEATSLSTPAPLFMPETTGSDVSPSFPSWSTAAWALTATAGAATTLAGIRALVRRGLSAPSTLPHALSASAQTVALPRGNVNYYHRPGTGTPLVFVHSFNAAASSFELEPLFHHFAETTDRPLYALDWLGFGRSDRPDINYTPDLYQTHLFRFLDEVVETPTDLIALSLGSEYAAFVALTGAPLVRKLVLLNPTGLGERRGASAMARAMIRGSRRSRSLRALVLPPHATGVPPRLLRAPDFPAPRRRSECPRRLRSRHQPRPWRAARSPPLHRGQTLSRRCCLRHLQPALSPDTSSHACRPGADGPALRPAPGRTRRQPARPPPQTSPRRTPPPLGIRRPTRTMHGGDRVISRRLNVIRSFGRPISPFAFHI